jgi:hypothetical protein
MKKANIIFILIGLPLSVYSQIIWNEPPDTIWYGNHSRWVEVILPTPQNLIASSINNNQVKLTWNEYWTQEMFDAYLSKFGYVAIPNRFSLYRQNITNGELQSQAIPSAVWNTTEYTDTNVELSKEYVYKIMAPDGNYLTIGGLQHWSPRSAPATIKVEAIPLSIPNNFSGYYEPDSAAIILSWDFVNDATYYLIYKSYIDSIRGDPNNHYWLYLTIPVGNVYEYHDIKLLKNFTYIYQIISINGNTYSDRSSAIMVSSGTLSIEDEEYWEAVEEYEKDRNLG